MSVYLSPTSRTLQITSTQHTLSTSKQSSLQGGANSLGAHLQGGDKGLAEGGLQLAKAELGSGGDALLGEEAQARTVLTAQPAARGCHRHLAHRNVCSQRAPSL